MEMVNKVGEYSLAPAKPQFDGSARYIVFILRLAAEFSYRQG
jgi:hypothetical protein